MGYLEWLRPQAVPDQPMDPDAPSLPFPAPEELSRWLPAYDVEDITARTSTVTVYRGRQIALDRPVAIAVLSSETSVDSQLRTTFHAQARAMARLSHTNLIGVYDVGEAGGIPFVVLEWVEGAPLSEALLGEAIDPQQAAQLIRAMCRGLEHSHAAGIVLGEVRPENILLDQEANPKIANFLGCGAPDEAASPYAAPEVVAQTPADARADVFSAGVLFHELLTGQLPDEERIPPSSLSGSPAAFDEIVRRATEKDPEARYGGAGEMADAIDAALVASAAKVSAAPGFGAVPLPDTAREVILPVSPAPFIPVPPRPASEKAKAGRSFGDGLVPFAKAAVAIALIGVAGFFAKPYVEEFLANRGQEDTPIETAPPDTVAEAVVEEASEPEAQPEAQISTEATMASLSKLKEQLAAGARDAFPEGAAARGASHFLLVGEPMAWDQAAAFAEAHGAHLAVFPSAEDRQWFGEQFLQGAAEKTVWVGAGATPDGKWLWIDGEAWSPDNTIITPPEPDHRIALSSSETVEALPAYAAQVFPFAIQWRDNGENPGSLLAQLKRAGEDFQSAGRELVRYPAGTTAYGGSRYVLLTGARSWDDARLLAQQAGGHLAAPSSPEEFQWYRDAFQSFLGGGGTLWLGGYKMKEGDPWQWITREAWKFSEWLPGQPGENPAQNRLLLRGQSTGPAGWVASTGAVGDAQAMLLEWSDAKPEAPGAFDLNQWLAGVNRNFRMRVEPDLKSYDLERKEALTAYARSLKRVLRSGNFTGYGGRGFARGANQVLEATLDNHIGEVRAQQAIVDIPNSVPAEFRALQTEAKENLEKLDQGQIAKMQAHREFYLQGLTQKADDLFATGFTDDSAGLRKIIAATADLEAFTAAIQL